ncbi:MAG: serine/threonine-protein kinase [Planctomycetota bacterium]
MPESAQKVLHELTAAGLLSSDEVTKYDVEANTGVDALLERLIEEERITKYQAEKFRAGQASDIYFGDYIVLEELGRGGMGTVLLARHRRMDREVAIKVLPISALDSEAAVARFYQEVKVAAQLTHPNIVHAYDAGEHHGIHYLVMEYVKGHDLARVLEQLGPIPASLAIDYLIQAAQGLEYAHRKGIIHRDIKPSNLLLDDEGKVKILDMGLARLGKGIGGAEASMHLTTTGQVMGTVEYMSPEQAEDTRAADERSDIYSLGCTLYRLVTGIAPFARETVVKTILAHREAPIPDFKLHKHPELAPIDNLFQRMVAKKPQDRIQNATILVQELRRVSEQLDLGPGNVVLDAEVEVIEPSAISRELPTQQFGSTDKNEIEYTSEVRSGSLEGQSFQADPSVGNASSMEAPTVGIPMGSGSTTNPYAPPINNPSIPHAMPYGSGPDVMGKPHRGVLMLSMGVLSLVFTFPCFIGVIIGIITWVYAQNDLAEMREGIRDPAGNNLTQAGRVLAMISCGIGAIWTLISLMPG